MSVLTIRHHLLTSAALMFIVLMAHISSRFTDATDICAPSSAASKKLLTPPQTPEKHDKRLTLFSTPSASPLSASGTCWITFLNQRPQEVFLPDQHFFQFACFTRYPVLQVIGPFLI